MKTDFWKLRSSEAVYILLSRIFVAVITLPLLSNESVRLSSGFLFSYFMARSLSGIALSHQLEKLPKKWLLISLSGLFTGIVCATILNFVYFKFNSIPVIVIAICLEVVDSFYAAVVNAFIPSVAEKDCDEAFRKTFLMQASIDLFGIALGMTGYSILGLNTIFWLIFLGSCIVLVIQASIANKGLVASALKEFSADSIIQQIAL